MDEKRLAEIRARAEAATPGPWKTKWFRNCACECDADFIAHSRTDIPDLLAEVERLSEDLAMCEHHIGGLLVDEDTGVACETIPQAVERFADERWEDEQTHREWTKQSGAQFQELRVEVKRLREAVGLAEGRRECAQANYERVEQMLANQNAGLAVMARERDEARAEVERLRSACTSLADAWGEMTPNAEVFTAEVGSECPERDRDLRDALLTCVKAVRP